MNLYKVDINKSPLFGSDRYQKAYVREKARERASQDTKLVSVLGICICVCLWIYVAFTAF